MSIPERSFVSHAKVMITGEYLVLKGSRSLALPLRFKQKLRVLETDGKPRFIWISNVNNSLWFKTTMLLPDFNIIETNIPEVSITLRNILVAAKKLNPLFLGTGNQNKVISEMDFDPAWGIGSSSSLVSNIAYWADCDPFQLNKHVFNGSGYDVACTRASAPIIYELKNDQPVFREADFHPTFHHQLYFAYLNRKQSSRESIRLLDQGSIKTDGMLAVSELTDHFEKATDLIKFQSLMDQHEEIIAGILGAQPVKKRLFQDFEGSVKSLGAWGGDFILVASSSSEKYVRDYFKSKKMTLIFRYNELVLNT